ncbi:bifunctional indole-3-glycerol-phosphate synthase TrpC/phosphoribosylanthranilate isomerase TrpF [Sphingomonas sp.]|uniref:bifunctional indole-3-glycerol-phosphate synthase TrpC/phosphoribosylanthranilate isomerase TrpF n=1 Tax=Sphingomonas sp. TaxID=28214 RepID=UPI0025E0DB43|nr:bifunctional indole-3-glycerol-phosphate synthase TrpC/phosphoribosylanthranilate isomerase TrpF [Sphingomonas sp.]MBV9528746.1 bifunctional indole-3-glycerol-phosphate synthase TrpC/phosphoribosylanthranilate isomerase TrpF [Sphingomonas sp.]
MAEGILGEIVARKRDDLVVRYHGVSLDVLRTAAERTDRSLAAAIAKPGARFILEIKKASPSEGTINPAADVGAVATAYAPVADALSVLADSAYFGGSVEDVASARRHFDGPILAKDFFVDLRQVAEVRAAGADAILVMLSVLDDEAARAMIDEASRFGMEALVEVHDEAEMRRALGLDAMLIGINNRNLRDLSIHLSTTERLASMAPDHLLVSESGIGSRADVERLAGHVDGFLVGTTLMRSADPGLAARELVFGRVKLCGLNRPEDIGAAAPATFAGFVFVPGTPRAVTVEEAAPLIGAARAAGMLPVGVFRDAPVGIVADAATLLNLHAVQLHGQEAAGYLLALRSQLPDEMEIWTAASVGAGVPEGGNGDRTVFDNASGGSGQAFDWAAVEGHPDLARSLIAGGIGAHNAHAARQLGAYAIDVGSAVDLVPGVKSPEKIAALFEALRAPSRQKVAACA